MRTKFKGFIIAGALLAAMASTASATQLCAGTTDVTTLGAGGCDVAGDPGVIFSNFTVSVVGAASATVGISSTSDIGGDIGLQFQIALGAEPIPGVADVLLSYTATGGLEGVDDEFQATPLVPGGGVTISELVCSVPFATGCAGTTLAQYAGTSTGQTVQDSASFTSGVTSPVYIHKDIDFGDAVMSGFTNSQATLPASGVPETTTFSLVGAGLVGLGLLGRRFGIAANR